MRRKKLFFSIRRSGLSFLLALFLFGGLLPVTGPARAAGDLSATLERIRTAAESVNTVSSRMEQEKHLKAFPEVLKASGRFAFKRPDCWRWELSEPVTSGLAVCGESGRRWHENGGKVQKFKLKDEPWLQHFATQVTAWTTADFAFLKQQYAIALLKSSPPILQLAPRQAAARNLISSLEIFFSTDCRYVEKIIIRESDDDYTVIKFLDVTINQPLPPDAFN